MPDSHRNLLQTHITRPPLATNHHVLARDMMIMLGASAQQITSLVICCVEDFSWDSYFSVWAKFLRSEAYCQKHSVMCDRVYAGGDCGSDVWDHVHDLQ